MYSSATEVHKYNAGFCESSCCLPIVLDMKQARKNKIKQNLKTNEQSTKIRQ
jgi:hypothetical protein